jgi:hypothetical protein
MKLAWWVSAGFAGNQPLTSIHGSCVLIMIISRTHFGASCAHTAIEVWGSSVIALSCSKLPLSTSETLCYIEEMAIAHAINFKSVWGDKRVVSAVTTFDNSYPTGGEAIVAADFGLSYIENIQCANASNTAVDRVVTWDRTNSKLFITVMSTGVEAANTSDQSATSANLLVIGH